MSDKILYSQEFMHYYKNPIHKGTLKNADLNGKSTNLSCGDFMEVFIDIDQDIIKEVKYTGSGCVISLASAEILSEFIEGKNINEIREMTEEYFFDLLGIDLTPSRQKCALIIFGAIKNAICKENK